MQHGWQDNVCLVSLFLSTVPLPTRAAVPFPGSYPTELLRSCSKSCDGKLAAAAAAVEAALQVGRSDQCSGTCWVAYVFVLEAYDLLPVLGLPVACTRFNEVTRLAFSIGPAWLRDQAQMFLFTHGGCKSSSESSCRMSSTVESCPRRSSVRIIAGLPDACLYQ